MLELAGDDTRSKQKNRITPKNIHAAVGADDELIELFKDVIIASGGVTPKVHRELFPETSGGKGKGLALD